MVSLTLRALCLVLALAGAGATAQAQERRWEIELYGGAVAVRTATEGSRKLPPAGAPLVTTSPIFPSREVPSWFFGDGVALLNGVVEEFGLAAKVTPLDGLFGRMRGGRSAAAGVRIHRRVSARLAAEVSVDWLGPADAAPEEFAAAVENVRSTYASAFGGLLASGPFSSVAIEATASSEPGSRHELAATAAVNVGLWRLGPLLPYATIGGGLLAGTGTLPSAELAGHYRFAVLGEVPISETDRVTLRFARRPAFVAVLGGGLRRDLSGKWGLRLDVRALVGPDSTRVFVDTAASTVRGAPAGFVESFTNPAVQFSNDPATGRRSTLSAPPLQGVRVFSGGGQVRTLITLGVSRRF